MFVRVIDVVVEPESGDTGVDVVVVEFTLIDPVG